MRNPVHRAIRNDQRVALLIPGKPLVNYKPHVKGDASLRRQGNRILKIPLTAETQSTRRFAEILCASLCALRLCGKWRAGTRKGL